MSTRAPRPDQFSATARITKIFFPRSHSRAHTPLMGTNAFSGAAAALPSAPSMIEENAALSAAIKQKSAAYTALERELAICRAQRADFADMRQARQGEEARGA